MKYCQDCGTKLRDNSKFCEGCGRKIVSQSEYEKEIEKKYRKELEEKIRKEIEEEKKNQHMGYYSWQERNKSFEKVIAISIILSLLIIVLFAIAGNYEFAKIQNIRTSITKSGFPFNAFTFKNYDTSTGWHGSMEIDILGLIIDLLIFIVILSIIFFAIDFIYYKIKSRKI